MPLAYQCGGLECCCVSPGRVHPQQLGQSSPSQDPPRVSCVISSTCGFWLGSSSSAFLWYTPISQPFSAGITPRTPPAASGSTSGPRCLCSCSMHRRAMVQPLLSPNQAMANCPTANWPPAKNYQRQNDPWKTPCTGMEQWCLTPDVASAATCPQSREEMPGKHQDLQTINALAQAWTRGMNRRLLLCALVESGTGRRNHTNPTPKD